MCINNLQAIMHVLGLLLIVGIAAANQCSKEQEENWEIELLLEHEDCNKFYKCTYGQPVEMVCPAGLFFNLEKSQCDWKENVNCGDRNIPEGGDDANGDGNEGVGGDGNEGAGEGDGNETVDSCDTEQKEIPEFDALDNGCPKNSSIHWLLPHESDCSQFYYCVGGEKVLKDCPPLLYFNRIIQVCVLPQQSCCAQSFDKDAFSRRLMMKK